MKVDEPGFEKIDLPPKESFWGGLKRVFLRELRILSSAIIDYMRGPLILLKRIFLPKTVDKTIKPRASWFHISPENPNGKALLLCHGFTSTPEIFKEIAPILAAEGYYVRAIRLAGHGTSPGHFAQTTASEWFASVVWHYLQIKDEYEDIGFVGHSLGGTLGLLLSTVYPINTVIALSTPIELDIKSARYVREASILVKYWPKKGEQKQYYEREGISAYNVTPLYAVGGIFDLCNLLKKRSERLNVEVLYVRAKQDHKTLLNQPEKFKKYFPNTTVEFRDLKESPHWVLQGPERETVHQWIIDWMNQCL